MFELPGLSSAGSAEADAQALRAYLTRLIPQLESILYSLQSDGFADAYNRLHSGMETQPVTDAQGRAREGTTAAQALAAHLMDTGNPHRVTAEQAGIEQAMQAHIAQYHAGGERE